MRAAAFLDEVGIALQEDKGLRRHAEILAQQLGKAGFVTLPR